MPNAEGARYRRPAAVPITDLNDSAAQVRALRVGIILALEALADGDAREATATLLRLDDVGPHGRSRCRWCGFRDWPGALEHHLLTVHHLDWDDVDEQVRRAA